MISKQTIDTVLSGDKWKLNGSNIITFSFYDDDVPNSYYGDEKVSEVSRGIKNNIRQILKDYVEPFVDLKFVEVDDSRNNYGQIRYQLTDMGNGYAYAYYPGNYGDIAGDVHLSNKSDTNNGGGGFQSGQGSYGFETLIHETFHALGLKHPGDYNGNGSGDPPFLPAGQDNNTNTVMTYNDIDIGASTPMLYDIKALQYLYGANQNHNSGNTVYTFDKVYAFSDGNRYWGNKNRATKLALWDGGGTDLLDFSKLEFNSSGYRLDLRSGGMLTAKSQYNSIFYRPYNGSGQFKTSGYGTVIADDMTIENVINSNSDDTIFANDGANTFGGYRIDRSTGDDKIIGADGEDVLDLSSYTNLTPTQNGDDIVFYLDNNGSVTIKDYYQAAESDRIQILTSDSNPTPDSTTNSTPVNGALVWEAQGLADESAIASGSQFILDNGVTVTVNWEIVGDRSKFTPHAGEDYVSFDTGRTGKHEGYLSLGFDNSNDDPDDLIKLSLDFNQAVTGLNFKLLDVDQSKSAGKTLFDDGVEIHADGINIKNLSGVEIVTGDNVKADNESYMNGFEGSGNAGADNSSDGGNIDLNFGSTEVSSLEIKYFSTDDANSDPHSQKIGISDLLFQTQST